MSGSRVSEAARERDRISSRNRAARNRDAVHKTQKEYRERAFEERPFIGWDSEGYDYFICHPDGMVEVGPQRTMLFGCSVPGRYIVGMELHTKEMLDCILQVEADFPDAFHVGFSFEYDVNQILRDLPWRMLAVLRDTGKVKWDGYRIAHIPHKMLTVSKDGIAATIYDVFGYFHCKYTTALEKYHVGSDEIRKRIARGKSKRGKFTWADIEEVIEYWSAEISLLPALVEEIRTAAYRAGFRIHQWYGPGALASYALRYNNVRSYMSGKTPQYVQAAVRAAFAGGRFQAWQCGEYYGDVYTLDKNSAYVQAIAELPNMATGKWSREDASKIKQPGDIARFGLYHIVFDDRDSRAKGWRRRGISEPPYPLFHRDKNGKLTWPSRVDGWYWSPEARLVAGSGSAQFVEAYVFRDDGTKPFAWVNESYEARRVLKERGDPAEKAFKWSLAAIFGAFARRVGWNKKTHEPPRSHELAWAGYITSHCRAAIYDVAAYAYANGGLISVDTDGVTSTVPFPESLVPEGFGDQLGQWKQEHFSGIVYWQNGIYWLRDENGNDWSEAKSRGVPKGKIELRQATEVLASAHFEPRYSPDAINKTGKKHEAIEIVITRSKYVGYRQGLNQQFNRWRVWNTEEQRLVFGGAGKGFHQYDFCAKCRQGIGQLHTITVMPPRQMVSEPHQLPWLVEMPDDIAIGVIDLREFIDEVNDKFREGLPPVARKAVRDEDNDSELVGIRGFRERPTDIYSDNDLEDNL